MSFDDTRRSGTRVALFRSQNQADLLFTCTNVKGVLKEQTGVLVQQI